MVAITNPFLLGNYAPVHDEVTADHLGRRVDPEELGPLPADRPSFTGK